MKLLENAMTEEMKKKTGDGWVDGKGRFLIDGFPRKLDQAIGFDETVRGDVPHLTTSRY
jgi:UMP-CMP kinase